jgi:hypothetical protein
MDLISPSEAAVTTQSLNAMKKSTSSAAEVASAAAKNSSRKGVGISDLEHRGTKLVKRAY